MAQSVRAAGAGFEGLLAAVERRRSAGARAIGRLHPTARRAVGAAWAVLSGGPLVWFTATDAELLETAADFEALLGALGAPRRVFRLPGSGVNPYSRVAPHAEALALRAEALTALASSRGGRSGAPAPVVIASAAGALARTVAPNRLAAASVRLRLRAAHSPAGIARRLAAAGYRYEDPVSSPGDFARRGGIVDVFPTNREFPVRIEFDFDRIGELRDFDPSTQRAARGLERPTDLRVPPASEHVGVERRAPEFSSALTEYLGSVGLLIDDPERFADAAEAERTRVFAASRAAAEQGLDGQNAAGGAADWDRRASGAVRRAAARRRRGAHGRRVPGGGRRRRSRRVAGASRRVVAPARRRVLSAPRSAR